MPSHLIVDPVAPNRSEALGRPSQRERVTCRLSLAKMHIQQWMMSESQLFRTLAGACGVAAVAILRGLGRAGLSFRLLCKLHRADFLDLADSWAERTVRNAVADAGGGRGNAVLDALTDHIDTLQRTSSNTKFFDNPGNILGPLAMVLKSPRGDEKGVLLLQYSHTFPLFARFFDVPAVASRYHVVLEPDWSGFCDPNILCFARYQFPVFVQGFEPRDAEFITGTHSNLIIVPTSTNWWVDHRLFHPIRDVEKDIDVVMVAGWGRYKRHGKFFAALSKIRRAGRRLRVLLLGYPFDFTREEILTQAACYGVDDQIEIHEWIPYDEVNSFVNRAKVSVIWSLKEGVNRAIIESMFANVPCVIREGFNYGYPYPYINSQTGCFASERGLPNQLLHMIDRAAQYHPRDWVMNHMSCQRAAEILSNVIGQTCAARGEPWSGGIAVKVNKLHDVTYWDPQAAARFESDYAFLKTLIRPQ